MYFSFHFRVHLTYFSWHFRVYLKYFRYILAHAWLFFRASSPHSYILCFSCRLNIYVLRILEWSGESSNLTTDFHSHISGGNSSYWSRIYKKSVTEFVNSFTWSEQMFIFIFIRLKIALWRKVGFSRIDFCNENIWIHQITKPCNQLKRLPIKVNTKSNVFTFKFIFIG